MPYASELNKSDKKPSEKESFLTNTENETELPAAVHSPLFTESLDEEIEADLDELRAHLQASISNALPGFYEFRQAGYNLLHPKMVDIEALKSRVEKMQIPILTQPQHKQLEQVSNAFLDRFMLLRKESEWHNNTLEFIKFRTEVKKAGWDEPQKRDYHQAIKHANRLSGYLSETLDLISLLNEKVEQQTSQDTFRQVNYDVLLNELLPVNADAHNDQYAAQTRGNLTGVLPDNIKFNAIVDSVTLDERLARERLSAGIESLSARLLSGITLTSNYAKKTDETDITREIKREIDFLCQVLRSVIHVVQSAGQHIQPEAHPLLQQKEARTKTEIAKRELGKTWSTVGQKVQGAIASGRTLSDKFNKNKHRIVHAFPGSAASDTNGESHNINNAVFQVGIRLLDTIQQATSDMHKAIQASRPLQQAVMHYSELDKMLSGMPHNSILDAKLRAESGRWKKKAEESKEQLQHLLGIITPLSDEKMKQSYLSALRDELKAATNPLVSNNVIRDFDTQINATVEGVSGIQKALNQALSPLFVHNKNGGKDLDKLTVSWLHQLKDMKDKLKTGIMQATGQSINNFSRQGMLARWMAEWNEAEKQRYLGTLSAEGRAVTEKHYDTVFFELIQHYLPLLSKESDPQGERLLGRLRLEVGNAAKGNTLYPATMADILAGMKSREQSIRDWSERKLIRGAFLAVCLDAVTLLPNLAALPLRLPIKFAVTGAKVAWGAHKGRQGIRGGEGDVTDEIAEFAKQSYKTAAIKIVLSLPPGLSTTLGVASIAWSVYEGGLEGAGKKIAKHIIGEAPWRALDAGSKAVAESYVTTLINSAITGEDITSVSHSSPLLPQTDVQSFSAEHAPDTDQPRVRRKREVMDRGPTPPQSPERYNNIPSSAVLQSGHFDFNKGIRYERLTDENKKHTYLNAIKYVLLQIQNDTELTEEIRDKARLARIGAKLLVPVDIRGLTLNNTIFLPDSPRAKSGVLIRLDSERPYYYVNKGTDLLPDIILDLPHGGDQPIKRRYKLINDFIERDLVFPSGVETIHRMRNSGGENVFNIRFNSNNPEAMNIVSLSATLADTIKADYSLKGETIINKSLIARAIAGAHIPDPGVTVTEVQYEPELTLADLTPSEYLESFSRPFAALSRDMQLVSSFNKGETIQQTELHAHQAEYIGSWVDATVGTFTSFTPDGWVINTLQSVAKITADVTAGKDADPLMVAGLIIGCIPGEKIAAKVGKFTRIGGNVVKYGVLLGNKVVDLAIVGDSIKTAAESGDPLDIYRACLASGMSAAHSYKLTKSMSSELKISIKVDGSAQLNTTQSDLVERLKAPENGESISQGRSTQDESPENVQGIPVYAGPSAARSLGNFAHPTEHSIKLNDISKRVFNTIFSGERIKSYDSRTSKFKADDRFTVAKTVHPLKNLDKIISSETQAASIHDMEAKAGTLLENLRDFEGDGKEDIDNNLRIIKAAFVDLRRNMEHVDNNVESNFYMLVKKDSNHEDINNHYGFADMRYTLDKSDISINYIVAHPYVVINKYPAFKHYLIENNLITASDFAKYNIKNVARNLGFQALKSEVKFYDSFPKSKVKSFSFNGANPITQRLGSKLQSLADYLSITQKTNKQDIGDENDEFVARRSNVDPFQENIQFLKSKVRTMFTPIQQIAEVTDGQAVVAMNNIMEAEKAEIISHDINNSKNSENIDIRDFSLEVIDSVNRSFEKVSSVKSLIEQAEYQSAIKTQLVALLKEATGLNDEVLIGIDNVPVSDISDMVYNRFKDNVNNLHSFLSEQISKKYKSFVLFKYNETDPSKPDAYALPYDRKKRILLAMLPESQRHGGLVDTVIHEASHNASYTLDHTYIGNVRSETGSFPSSFDLLYRDPKHFHENDRVGKLSTNYALGLPEGAEPTQDQKSLAKVLLHNSKLIKSDTLLNAAEYNAYMIDVLSRARIQDSRINLEQAPSRSRRSVPEISDERDNIVMLASLKVALPSGNQVVTASEHEQERAPQVIEGMIPPVSKATAALEYFVDLAKATAFNEYKGPYTPSAGDFTRKSGESIYVAKSGRYYIYVNNEYFPFRYSNDKSAKYKARVARITIGKKEYVIFRKTWWWSTERF